ncbi:MAG: branched-chain amino acid transaminase [Alphaproteobacteria bacterium]|nr:branched-chain amino acid transaminase [Alphaproteobacteria bacterium]MBT5389814.1 branched-chain amino acid transaminase [Alphaproteobacteria bacterium]MBT5541020.1 branched-chain amino acid transaminase [Alphaproteobacteria bacterium]MBT5654508.1 branched-chain amino acid transaminase [Alphaproteobacteria bacterium]
MSGFDDRDGVIWKDGAYVPWRKATLHVLSHGLHYATSIFEGIRVYDSRAFMLKEHLERFFKSAAIMSLEIPYSLEELMKASQGVIERQKITDGYLRPVAWLGSEKMGITSQGNSTHVAIAVWEWPKYFAPEANEKGIRVMMPKWRRPPPHSAPAEAKAAGIYMLGHLARRQVEEAGFDDALLLDHEGRLAECTGANFFMVKSGVIYTPKPESFLDGLTRQTVMTLAEKEGYEMIEKDLFPKDLDGADELFITGTAVEVTPIREVHDYGTFPVGPVTKLLRTRYQELVRKK